MSAMVDFTELLTRRFGLRKQPAWPEGTREALASVCRGCRVNEDEARSLLASDAEILQRNVGYFTIGESHFMRHRRQLDETARYIKRRLDDGAPELVIWSAGCCRGEEPFSLLIAAADYLTAAQQTRLRVIAHDIDPDAIATAKAGVFEPWSFRGVPPTLRERFFEKTERGRYRISPRLRQRVDFAVTPVLDLLPQTSTDSVDVILFRNVAIYLTADHTARVYEGFSRVLSSCGKLVIAPTDPAPARAVFVLDKPGKAIYRPAKAPTDSTAPAAAPPLPPEERLAIARALANARKYQRALTLLEPIAARGALLAAIRLTQGQIYLELGQLDDARKSLAAAVVADPDASVARYWYALALKTNHDSSGAVEQLTVIRRQLQGVPRDRVLEPGTTARELLHAVAEIEGAIT